MSIWSKDGQCGLPCRPSGAFRRKIPGRWHACARGRPRGHPGDPSAPVRSDASSSSTARIRRSDRDRICWTLARLRPVVSAISGPLSSPPKRSAMISRSRALSVASARSRSAARPRSGASPRSRERFVPAVELVERLLAGAAVGAEVVDEQVARDDDEPRADARLVRVVARPRLQRALEGQLREVLGVGAGAHPVGEEAVDLPDVLVVDG